ncbi:MAG: hypothetical protein ACREQZ_02100 [Woeseiaceae bacterium]
MKSLLSTMLLTLVGAALAQGDASAQCENVTRYVGAQAKRGGRTKCDGWVGLYLTNRTTGRALCKYAFQKPNGDWDSGQTGIRAGKTTGGERGGMWTCGGTGSYRYYCVSQSDWRKDFSCRMPRF